MATKTIDAERKRLVFFFSGTESPGFYLHVTQLPEGRRRSDGQVRPNRWADHFEDPRKQLTLREIFLC